MLNAVIIDDEPDAVASIVLLLQEFCRNVKVVGTASKLTDGIKEIASKKPDLVFLDIEMPNGNGFELLDCLPERDFKIIFVTAYNEYAIQAIKAKAFDYLLKPVDIEELQDSVNRLAAQQKAAEAVQPQSFDHNMKIPISMHDGYYYIPAKDIIHLKAEGSYTIVYSAIDKPLMVSKNLKEFEAMLEDKGFFRVHNSHIINLDHVHKYSRTDGGYVELSDKSKIEISRNRKERFLKLIGITSAA